MSKENILTKGKGEGFLENLLFIFTIEPGCSTEVSSPYRSPSLSKMKKVALFQTQGCEKMKTTLRFPRKREKDLFGFKKKKRKRKPSSANPKSGVGWGGGGGMLCFLKENENTQHAS